MQKLQRGKGAIGHEDQLPLRQPAPQLKTLLPGPIEQVFGFRFPFR
jgi:hypothetical protein